MKIHDMIQGSDEWKAIRKGKMTASNAQAIGNNGKGLDTYIHELLSEEFSSGVYESYTNPHMERGNELEEAARAMFELEHGIKVDQVGFVEYSEYAGCSPDGLIGEDEGCEIKAHADKSHFRLILYGADEIDSKYMWQIQCNLLMTGRKKWKYIAYNPNFEKNLLVFDILPDPKMHTALLEGLKRGEELILSIKSKLQ